MAEYAVMLAVILIIVVATVRVIGFQREYRILAGGQFYWLKCEHAF